MRDEVNARVGEAIKARRRLAGLTAEQLAAKVPGLTRGGLAKIESGCRAVLPIDLLIEIAEALEEPLWAIVPDAIAPHMGARRHEEEA